MSEKPFGIPLVRWLGAAAGVFVQFVCPGPAGANPNYSNWVRPSKLPLCWNRNAVNDFKIVLV